MIRQYVVRKLRVSGISWEGIGLLLYVCGIFWLFLFPAMTITKGEFEPSMVYLDEHALGSTRFDLNIPLHKCDFQASTEKKLSQGLEITTNDSRQTFCSEVNALGFSCHEHVHTRSDGSISRSVYSVLHRQNGFSDRKDCIVLSSPLHIIKETNQWDGMYILLAVVRAIVEDEGWMSKNILLLGIDEQLSPAVNVDRFHFWEDTKSFLDDYHSVAASSNVLKRAGVIRAAIHLDLPPSSVGWNDVQIATTGFNGELPNMDMLVLMTQVMKKNMALPSLHRSILRYGPGILKDGFYAQLFRRIRSVAPNWARLYLFRLQSLFVNLVTMAFGPTGPHAQYLRYSIDAATIYGSAVKSEDENVPKSDRQAMANSIAISVRSLFGIEEDLHHSLYYYYPMGYTFYLSLQEFIWPVVIMLAPLLFSVLAVFSKLKQVPWLRGLLIILLFESYGVATLVLVGSVHNKFGGPVAEIITAILFIVASPLMAYVVPFLSSKILVEREQGQVKSDEDWMSVKGSFGSLVAYFIPVCAIVNFAFALWFTVSLVLLLSSARRFSDSSYASGAITTIWLLLTSPYIMVCCHLFCILGQQQPPNQLMSYWIHGWNLEGIMIFPCLCLVYLPSHMMATTVCLYPKRPSSK